MAEAPIFLVRHGRYERDSLSEAGRTIDSLRARKRLLEKGLGSNALILSSSLPRALETAGIIAEGLHANVFPSRRLAEGGNNVKGIRNLDEFLDKAMEEAGIAPVNSHPLVVVTHAPMLAVAKGLYDMDAVDDVGYGEVVDYQPGTWRNPHFKTAYEQLLEIRIVD